MAFQKREANDIMVSERTIRLDREETTSFTLLSGTKKSTKLVSYFDDSNRCVVKVGDWEKHFVIDGSPIEDVARRILREYAFSPKSYFLAYPLLPLLALFGWALTCILAFPSLYQIVDNIVVFQLLHSIGLLICFGSTVWFSYLPCVVMLIHLIEAIYFCLFSPIIRTRRLAHRGGWFLAGFLGGITMLRWLSVLERKLEQEDKKAS
jgi:hypothetical protein